MHKHPMQLRVFLKKIKDYGVIVVSGRGKGSESILLKPIEPGSKKGPQYPIKNHGMGMEISYQVIDKILERFNIDKSGFWG